MADEIKRPMKYPYTYTAMLAQFPYRHYWEKVVLTKYVVCAAILCVPVYYKIQKLSYAPANVELWAKKDRQLLGLEPH